MNPITRRALLQTTGSLAAASAFAGIAPTAFAGGDDEIRLALIGCGGRGTGAVADALATTNQGPIKLWAMADVFEDRLSSSHDNLKGHGTSVDVPPERRFVGFEGYKQAMDCLRPGDVVILTTPLAFRAPHFAYAIEKGLNVFMEKPVSADGPTSRRMLELNKLAEAKNLKVGVGLMCRHCDARGELFQRIRAGEIGELTLLRAYRMAGPTGSAYSYPRTAYKKPGGEPQGELEYQIRRFHSFLWASGGAMSDFMIHNIDECCWMKDAWPVSAKASGGRHYREGYVDQNFDSYSIEYTFADGTKLMANGRYIGGCHGEFASYAMGTKGCAIISANDHTPANPALFKGYQPTKDGLLWKYGKPEANPYRLEWQHLVKAIRAGDKYNEVERGVAASLVTTMGRFAAHTGTLMTYDKMLAHDHELAAGINTLKSLDDPAPVVADEAGRYPVPQPGTKTKREY